MRVDAPIPSLHRGRLALVAAGVLWSLSGVFIKLLPVHPVALTFYRSLFAALALLLILGAVEMSGRHRPGIVEAGGKGDGSRRFPPWREMLVSILLFAALLVTFVMATKLTTAANAIILQYTAPIYVIGLSPLLLRERPRREDLAALALCMAGVAVIFFGNYRPGAGGPQGRGTWGLSLGLISGLCFGLFTLWQRRLRAMDPVLLAGLNNAGAALVLAGALPWAGPVGAGSLAALVVMGVVQIAIPYALFAWALQRVPGPEASLLTLIEPVLNPVWVALFVGEAPSSATVTGGMLILAALLLRYTVSQ